MTPLEFKEKYKLCETQYDDLCMMYGESFFEYGSMEEINIAVIRRDPSVMKRLSRDDLTDRVLNSIPLSEVVYSVSPTKTNERIVAAYCYADAYNLLRVPKEYITVKLTIECIRRSFKYDFYHDRILERMVESAKYPTDEHSIYLEYVKRFPSLLHNVPSSIRTREICFTALKNKLCMGFMIEHVPEKYRDEEICMYACQRVTEEYRSPLRWVPESVKTYEMCREAVKRSVSALKYVPKKLLTKEIYTIHLNKYKSLDTIPLDRRTVEVIEMAFVIDIRNIRFMPNATLEMYTAAAKEGYLEYVPKELVTRELCIFSLEACREDDHRLKALLSQHIPRRLQTTELLLKYIEVGGSLKHISHKTEEICTAAVRQNPLNIEFVPIRVMTEEICYYAARTPYCLLKKIEDTFKSKRACLEYVTVNRKWQEICWIPDKYRDEELYITALPCNSTCIIGMIPIERFTSTLLKEIANLKFRRSLFESSDKRVQHRIIRACRYEHKRKYSDVMNELIYLPINNFPKFKKAKKRFEEMK